MVSTRWCYHELHPSRYGFDPPTVWDGKHPVHEWQRWKRTVQLREAASDIPEERRGVRVFRRGLVVQAAEMADAMTDDQI